MIGGEAAEWALERRSVADAGAADARDPYGLGWVTDWLYGDAVLPPMPLSRDPEPDLSWRRPPIHVKGFETSPEPRRSRRHGGRRVRQLTLL